MKTKTINLYSYDELDTEAQEKAYQDWLEDFDVYSLQVFLDNRLEELLEDHKIKPTRDLGRCN
jgi:hypothetical protein